MTWWNNNAALDNRAARNGADLISVNKNSFMEPVLTGTRWYEHWLRHHSEPHGGSCKWICKWGEEQEHTVFNLPQQQQQLRDRSDHAGSHQRADPAVMLPLERQRMKSLELKLNWLKPLSQKKNSPFTHTHTHTCSVCSIETVGGQAPTVRALRGISWSKQAWKCCTSIHDHGNMSCDCDESGHVSVSDSCFTVHRTYQSFAKRLLQHRGICV